MILDSDLTTAPEELPKFYDAVVSGRCDFANGSRLVYPMDEEAMRFLNLISILSVTLSCYLERVGYSDSGERREPPDHGSS